MTKLQSNRQGDSASNEQSFGKITSQESHTQHKDSGGFFFLLLLMYFQFCTCKLNALTNSTKNVQQVSKTNQLRFHQYQSNSFKAIGMTQHTTPFVLLHKKL